MTRLGATVNDLLARIGIGDGEPIKRHDRPRWAAARTLQDLCDLTVLWLAGDIDSQPGYHGRVDVDEDDAPGITGALIALNRAGFLTSNSQGAYEGPEYAASPWEAWVSGFTDDATFMWLRGVLAGTGFGMFAWPAPVWYAGRFWRPAPHIVVGPPPPDDDSGYWLSGSQIARTYDGCSEAAVDALCVARQVTVYDPRPGPNDLWPVLRAAAEQRTGVTA